MQSEMSIISLILEASLVVKIVMLILVGMSVLSWAVIFNRGHVLKKALRNFQQFSNTFNKENKPQLLKELHTRKDSLEGAESIFYAGAAEFSRLNQNNNFNGAMLGSERSMRVAIAKEMETLELKLPFLATVGSISPYIGLFGTVWGIMTSFIALGQEKQATLAMVAPGIAEALIATAIGLFAAIPAVMAFNRLSNKVSLIEQSYATFAEEVQGELHRQSVMEPKA